MTNSTIGGIENYKFACVFLQLKKKPSCKEIEDFNESNSSSNLWASAIAPKLNWFTQRELFDPQKSIIIDARDVTNICRILGNKIEMS